jgi:glycosyltransferase involved in cell wall biosynthesis
MSLPDVSVLVPVYNAMPYLATCMASLIEQSVGWDRLEVLAVDDGSTDGSGDLLDELARSWDRLRVIHIEREHSGGGSLGRNVGLDHAAGRYVFFLDADDYLAAEALERMVALADRDSADVVTCRRVQVGGIKGIRDVKDYVPLTGRSRHSGLDAAAFDSAVRSATALEWTALIVASADCKALYRRERIENLGLRFAPDIHFGEDVKFAGDYLPGAKASIVGDYDSYYERVREDGLNITTMDVGTEVHLDALDRGLRRQDHGQLNWRRDQILRDTMIEITQQTFNERFLERTPQTRVALVAKARTMLDTWLTPRTMARLPALDRLKAELIKRELEPELFEVAAVIARGERGKNVVDGGRVYGGFPYFGDPAAAIPDHCYDITGELPVCHYLSALSWEGTVLRLSGHAYIDQVDTVEMTTSLVLRGRGGSERRLPVTTVPVPGLAGECGLGRYDYGQAGFEIDFDITSAGGAPLEPGSWSTFLAVTAQGVTKEAPFGGNRATGLDGPFPWPAGGGASAHFAKYGTLTLAIPSAQPG